MELLDLLTEVERYVVANGLDAETTTVKDLVDDMADKATDDL